MVRLGARIAMRPYFDTCLNLLALSLAPLELSRRPRKPYTIQFATPDSATVTLYVFTNLKTPQNYTTEGGLGLSALVQVATTRESARRFMNPSAPIHFACVTYL